MNFSMSIIIQSMRLNKKKDRQRDLNKIADAQKASQK